MNFDSLLEYLQSRVKEPLPGQEAQYRMAHAFRRNWSDDVPETAVASAVMILLYPVGNEPHIAFIQRTSRNPNDKHSGQISFPGGRFEEGVDTSLLDCAIRETVEEIGVQVSENQVIVEMTPLYIPVSNFMVTPYLAVLDALPELVLQTSEVADVLQYPLRHFHVNENIKTTILEFGNGNALNDVRYYDLDGKILWGATAMMTSELMAMLSS
jgi:8-oxo-dGTP pyrophosphatase MutT (NUDIX family)